MIASVAASVVTLNAMALVFLLGSLSNDSRVVGGICAGIAVTLSLVVLLIGGI